MKVQYELHENVYKIRKHRGELGWSSEEELNDTIKDFEHFFLNNNLPKKAKILELGCGAGDFALWLSKKEFSIYGMDISETAINWAKEKAKKENLSINFTQGNVLNLNLYENNFFDCVIDGYCLHCIIGGDRKTFFQEIKKVLKKQGLFVIRSICNDPVSEMATKQFDSQTRLLMNGDIATRYMALEDDLKKEVENAGFKIIFSKTKKVELLDDVLVLYCINE
ncbi:MAG: methyltransferase domain-containing protein [Candidatus Sericytochromatia bacterium]